MIVVTLGLILTAILLWNVSYRWSMRPVELGSMSHQWIAAHHAAQPASSI
jgi:hypothetical protein